MPNNLNLNMSDYQKIIFANSINENTLLTSNSFSDIHNIKELSEKYPFVVFFTNYKDDAETNGETIHNIWKEGFRLTRFVGIDPTANKIQLGDHTVKLHFDYTSGLLSVVDCNQLKSITLERVLYTDRNNQEQQLSDVNLQNILIDAIDNKFKLVFRFELEENTDSNISQITKNLTVTSNNSNKFTIGNGYSYPITSLDPNKIGYYAYDCTIIYDTEISSNNSYTFTSIYDSTIVSQVNNLGLRLNPIDYDIILENTGQKLNNNQVKQLNAGSEYRFNVIIYPNGQDVNSYPVEKIGQTLALQVEAPNCTILNPYQHVSGPSLSFNLTTPNSFSNSSLLNVNLSLINTANNITSYINKNFKINLLGGLIYFYCGYTEPSNSESFINQMQDISGNINNKGFLLYDWQTKNWDINDDRLQYFYIAFSEGYENQIAICWDAYTITNGTNMYIKIDDNTRFINQSNHPTGITVYKASVPGKFFGKIQIQ